MKASGWWGILNRVVRPDLALLAGMQGLTRGGKVVQVRNSVCKGPEVGAAGRAEGWSPE